jgi:hypothetical protein
MNKRAHARTPTQQECVVTENRTPTVWVQSRQNVEINDVRTSTRIDIGDADRGRNQDCRPDGSRGRSCRREREHPVSMLQACRHPYGVQKRLFCALRTLMSLQMENVDQATTQVPTAEVLTGTP